MLLYDLCESQRKRARRAIKKKAEVRFNLDSQSVDLGLSEPSAHGERRQLQHRGQLLASADGTACTGSVTGESLL